LLSNAETVSLDFNLEKAFYTLTYCYMQKYSPSDISVL